MASYNNPWFGAAPTRPANPDRTDPMRPRYPVTRSAYAPTAVPPGYTQYGSGGLATMRPTMPVGYMNSGEPAQSIGAYHRDPENPFSGNPWLGILLNKLGGEEPGPARNRLGGLLGSGTAGRPAPRSSYYRQPGMGYTARLEELRRRNMRPMNSSNDFWQALSNAAQSRRPVIGNPWIGGVGGPRRGFPPGNPGNQWSNPAGMSGTTYWGGQPAPVAPRPYW